ncbi:hypothetical protein MMC32_004010 [Xylographa parallela]|nr:hypothetical protein [Xylographa parallela]
MSSATLYSAPSFTSSTNLGPMTTTITFPAECRDNLYDFSTDGIGVPWTYYTQGCALATCCPSGNFYTTQYAWYTSYYSPGVCPYAYTSCPGPSMITLQPSDSVAWCVPNGYGCPAPTFGTNASDPINFYNVFAQKTDLGVTTTAFAADNIFDQNILSVEPVQSYYWAAYPLQIRWKDSDFPTTTAGTSSPPATAVPVASAPATSSPSSLPPVSAPSTPHGLSSGVIAAIAVVASIAVLTVIAFLVCCLRRRARQRSRLRQQPVLPRAVKNQYDMAMQQEHFRAQNPAAPYVAEAYAGLPADSELEAQERTQELESRMAARRSVAELG